MLYDRSYVKALTRPTNNNARVTDKIHALFLHLTALYNNLAYLEVQHNTKLVAYPTKTRQPKMRNFTTSTSWLFLRILLLFISSNSIDTVLGCCSFNDYVLSYNDNDDANDNNDYNNISHIADQIWHNYFYKTIHRGDNEATIGPLKLLGCTLYRDSTGIDIAGDSNSPETSSWTKWKSKFCTKGWTKWKSMFCSIDTTTTTESATESATENYSRIPTVKETWELFEEAYLYATSSMHEGDVKDNDVVDGENWEGDDDDDKNWEGDDDDYDDDDHVYDNENEDKDVIDNNKGQDNNKELLQKDEILMRRRGMQVPYEVRYDKSGKIGRSMYATEFIPKVSLFLFLFPSCYCCYCCFCFFFRHDIMLHNCLSRMEIFCSSSLG
jgi:hypothetical protein